MSSFLVVYYKFSAAVFYYKFPAVILSLVGMSNFDLTDPKKVTITCLEKETHFRITET